MVKNNISLALKIKYATNIEPQVICICYTTLSGHRGCDQHNGLEYIYAKRKKELNERLTT